MGGAIEGLPLQLMIAVIVAGIALAIILGWVLSIQTPNVISRVEATPDPVTISGFGANQEATRTVTITVRAFDQRGTPIPGVVVTLEGAGVTRVAVDSSDGTTDGSATFPNLEVRLGPGQMTATIDVTVQASGFPDASDEILVVRQ